MRSVRLRPAWVGGGESGCLGGAGGGSTLSVMGVSSSTLVGNGSSGASAVGRLHPGLPRRDVGHRDALGPLHPGLGRRVPDGWRTSAGLWWRTSGVLGLAPG